MTSAQELVSRAELSALQCEEQGFAATASALRLLAQEQRRAALNTQARLRAKEGFIGD